MPDPADTTPRETKPAEMRLERRLGRLRNIAGAAVIVACLMVVGAFFALREAERHIGPPDFSAASDMSHIVVDRKGQLLRAFTTPDGRWRLPLDAADVDENYLELLLTYEDKRFWRHSGVDPLALMRAGWQLLTKRRIVSGGSTLTMQVARLLDGKHERTAGGKFRQIVRAIQLERRLTKREILNLYLRLAPFGGNLEGVRAASLAYFGKEPRRLSLGEAAMLVALPQSPEPRRPDRFPAAAKRARDRVLARAARQGAISWRQARRAMREASPHSRLAFPKYAAHLAEAEIKARPRERIVRLTLDRDLQSRLEALAGEHVRSLGRRLSAAIIVIDHRTGRILAHVGSAGYLDGARFGAIDMALATRSPGSTLKPFIYGLGFEMGLIHPETLIDDRPVRFGRYAPKNFDETYRGTVSIREALQLSLNVPVVKVLSAVGPGRFLARLRYDGAGLELPNKSRPSLAIALGGIGISLRELGGLYASIARGGELVRLTHHIEKDAVRHGAPMRRRILSPAASWQIGRILLGARPPRNAKAGRIAYKTGTSYGYRDAWAVGFDGKHTIAVWVGRPDGTATPGLTGYTAAAPMLFDAFARLADVRAPLPPPPSGILFASASELPPPLRRFKLPGERAMASKSRARPLQISFPPDKAELERGAGPDDGEPRPLVLKAEGGTLPLTWLVNGAPIRSARHRRDAYWQPDQAGFAKVSVVDAEGRVDRVTIRFR